MLIGYANDHAGNTFKMLKLMTKHIWKSCNIKWITTLLTHLDTLHEKQVCPSEPDHKDDEVLQYVRTMGVNLFLTMTMMTMLCKWQRCGRC